MGEGGREGGKERGRWREGAEHRGSVMSSCKDALASKAFLSPSLPSLPSFFPFLPPFNRRSVQMRKLADHMAFLTNHVFLVPDLYRGEVYGEGTTKEAWREAVREGGREGGRENEEGG